jgi:holliday junction DNA helicase RuvA
MIAFIEGMLVQAGREATVAVAGGLIGLDVLLSERSAARLPASGQTVRLWTHLVVREDGWTLYGFATREERAMFRLLLSVAGIGPRVALGILSGVEPAALAGLLQRGDERALARLPGIGKKSAARLVVELGQRVPATLVGGGEGLDEAAAAGAQPRDALDEAVQVLAAMGLPAVQAEDLLRQVRRGQPELTTDVPAWVRAALGRLGAPGR